MQRTLLKRGITLVIITSLFSFSILPTQADSKNIITNNEGTQEIYFGIKNHIDITWDENDTDEPIMPYSEYLRVPFNISYWVTWGIFGRLINLILGGKRVDINLEILNIPEWCTIHLPTDFITFSIPLKPNIKYTRDISIMVSLDENAPAYEEFTITFEAKIDDKILGPFGFFTLLSAASKNVNITLTPDYLPLIDIYLPQGIEIETPPLVEKQVPIVLTNLGNGKTIVECEVISGPPGFIIYFEPQKPILEIGGQNVSYLKITAPSNFSGYKTVTLGFTPHFYYNYSLAGITEFITTIVYY